MRLGALLTSWYRPGSLQYARLILTERGENAGQPEFDDQVHMEAAIDWLCRAQNVRNGQHDTGSVSAGWTLADGWLPGYPETSGYILETFIAAAKALQQPDLLNRVTRILDWELSIQKSDGSFPGHFNEPGARSVVFNTGQVMHGLVSGYIELGRNDCLAAAIRAGHWLVSILDEDGCWRRHTLNGIPHTYNTRTAWAMLRTAVVSGEEGLRRAAIRNLDWALSRQTASGWFADNAFTHGAVPYTHNIGYVLEGMLESGLLLGEERYIGAAERGALELAKGQRNDGWLAGTYADGWAPRSSYCCVTGVAQLSIIWNRLVGARGADDLKVAVERANRYLKRVQRITGRKDAVDGGIPGSVPFGGGYERFSYPNWAAKFFADALLMEMAGVVIPGPSETRPKVPCRN